MRKTISLLAISLLATIFFTSCRERAAITAEDFIRIVEGAGFSIVAEITAPDITGERLLPAFTQPDDTIGYTLAISPGGAFQIEFLVFETDALARTNFDALNGILNGRGGAWRNQVQLNRANFNHRRGANGGVFFALTRIENTLVYVETFDENRGAVNDILDLLGYR